MRALTVTQPWCGLIASGIKLVENRPRSIVKREDFGKPFAIHASREIDESVFARIREIAPDVCDAAAHEQIFGSGTTWYQTARITSAVIAVAAIERAVVWADADSRGDRHLVDAHTGELALSLGDQLRWFFGPIGYVLRDVRALATPVPCKGALGFWRLPDDVAAQVAALTPPTTKPESAK